MKNLPNTNTEICVPYGNGSLVAKIPRGCQIWHARPKATALGSPKTVLTTVLGSESAAQLLRPVLSPPRGRKSVVIVNDATRPTPTAEVLSCLIAQGLLEPEGLASGRLLVLVATGAHAPGGKEDLARILGPHAYPILEPVAHWHDCRSRDLLTFLGTTRAGTPVWINRQVAEADSVLIINSVEPHYFAGYTGGRKSIVPGTAGFETIEANHRLALDPRADILSLHGNPVHEDLVDAVARLDCSRIVSLQVVLDREQAVAAAFLGDLELTFARAVSAADDQFVVPVPAYADIVVTAAAPPMDYDLYQSQKALENGARALRPGGVLILVSQCRHGIGDRTYFDLLASSEHADDVLALTSRQYRLGYHKAARLASLATRFHLVAVTGLPYSEVRAAFMTPCATLQEAIEMALDRVGQEATVLVIPDGCVTVPRVETGGKG